MPVEVAKKGDFFDYELKQKAELFCPSSLTRQEKEGVADIAMKAHDILGLRDYSVSDFIVTPRGIYLLEINNLPGLTPFSILPTSLEASGASMGELVDHLIVLALGRK